MLLGGEIFCVQVNTMLDRAKTKIEYTQVVTCRKYNMIN